MESQTQLSFHLAQDFAAKHCLFIQLFLENIPELTRIFTGHSEIHLLNQNNKFRTFPQPTVKSGENIY